MNKKELAANIFKHPLIQEVIKKNIFNASIVSQIIVEEIVSEYELIEAATPKGNLAAKVRNYINRKLKNNIPPEDIIKDVSKGGPFFLKQVSSIDKVEDERLKQDLLSFLDSFVLKQIERLRTVEKPSLQSIDDLKQQIVKADTPKEKQEIIKQAAETGLVSQDQASKLIQQVSSLSATDEKDETAEEIFDKLDPRLADSARSIMKEKWWNIYKNSIKEFESNPNLRPLLQVATALFLANLMTVLNEKMNPASLSSMTNGQIEPEKFTDSLKKLEASLGVSKLPAVYKKFEQYVDSDNFANAFSNMSSSIKLGAQPSPTPEEPKAAAEPTITPEPTEEPEAAPEPTEEPEAVPEPTEEPSEVSPEEQKQITQGQTPEERKQEKQEIVKATEEATQPENVSDDFDKSEAEVPKLRYEEYTKSLNEFFGIDSDKPSFMKVFFLYQQVGLLQNNLVSSLNNIIDPPAFGQDVEKQTRAMTDISSEKGEQTPQPTPETGKQEKVEEEIKVFRDKSGKYKVKRGQEAEDFATGVKAGKKVKSAATTAVEKIKGLFTNRDKPQIKVSEKNRVALKRELAAQSDILIQAKKIASAYDKFGTSTSLDPEFDGSSLERQLKKILGAIQTHNARLVYIMASMIKEYEAEESAGGQIDEAKGNRKEKIKEIRSAFNQMGQLYKRSLRTSLEEMDIDKAQSTAKEMLEIAKKIIPYFPKTIVHTGTGKVVSLSDAIKALNGQIKSYKLILRDIFDTVQDDLIAPSHVSQMYLQINQLCSTIDSNFDVPCKIRQEDKKTIEDAIPDSGSISDEAPVEEPLAPEEAPEETPEQDPEETPETSTEEEYTVDTQTFSLAPLEAEFNKINQGETKDFDQDLDIAVNYLVPYLSNPPAEIREQEETDLSRKAIKGNNLERLKRDLAKLKSSNIKKYKSVLRVLKLLKTDQKEKFHLMLRKHIVPKEKEEVKESLTKRLESIIEQMLRGKNG